MAYYAFLDQQNIVTEVIPGKDENEGGVNWEQYYGDFRGQTCKRTSFNTRGGIHYDPETGEPSADQSKAFRKNFAGVGYKFDPEKNAFIAPQPYASWGLNETTCIWEAPVAYPTDGKYYSWDESTTSWKAWD